MKRVFAFGLLVISLQVIAQKPIATAPFELFGDHIFIKLSVDGSAPMDFIFDSGAGYSAINYDAATKLKLNLTHKESVAGAQGFVKGATIKHNFITMGDIKLESNVTLEAFDLKHLAISIGRPIDGIIGFDLLNHHVTRINYTDKLIEIYSAESFPKIGEKVVMKLHNAIPVIDAEVTLNNDETITGTFYLNTGAGTTIDFNSPFAKTNGVLQKTGKHYAYLVKGIENDEANHFEGRIKLFNSDFYDFRDVPIGISQAQSGLQADKKISGIIGNEVLNRFNITFDYANSVLYMEPNATIKNDFYVNCSGLDVQMSADMTKVLIHQVNTDGPAKSAGINSGDELVSINGKASSEYTLAEIKDLLKMAGEKIELEIKSTSGTKKVSLNLEKLL
jgi:predicted aspartyl protease